MQGVDNPDQALLGRHSQAMGIDLYSPMCILIR
jgi:hypothetical protein